MTTVPYEESHQLPGLNFRCRSLSALPFCMVKPRPQETSSAHILSSAPAHKSLCWIQAVKCEQRKPPCGGGDASNKRIVKLFPLVACPLPATVMEKIAGFPSAELFECGLYQYKKALHLLLAKETASYKALFGDAQRC
ncbi:uncharacterized protein LJ264_003063 [Porphyrio hochstetteri]